MKPHSKCVCAVLLFSIFINGTNANTPTTQQQKTLPTYDVRNCPDQQQPETNDAIRRLEILPGLGFDNLRNLDMGQVHLYNYSTCKVTEDGKYMIPDSVFVVPLQEGHYKFFADYYDHWDNYTSITSSRVNVEVDGLYSISGSYSKEKQSVKENQYNFKSKTTRISFRNRVYSVHLDSAAELHPTFKSKIYEISASVQNNDTGLTRYLSELLVRGYGTHFITSMEAGAVFVKLDSISETYASTVDKATITSAASASFPILQLFGNFSLGYDRNITEGDIEVYQTSLKTSEIFTVGGASFTPDLSMTRWVNDIPKRLATIDRTADPIYFAVTPTQFPELPIPTVRAVADSIRNATVRYYQVNTKQGCVDRQSDNFDFQANYGDSTYCNTTYSHIDTAFGGIYQTCRDTAGPESLCADHHILQKNPQTGDYSCPVGYTAVSLYNGTQSYTGDYTVKYKSCFVFHLGCSTKSRGETKTSVAHYETFWCVVINTNPQSDRGYLFGGYFTQTSTNMITGTQSCPPYYKAQKIAVDISICVTDDYELGHSRAVSFAGFHSCRVGNPLAIPSTVATFPARDNWPHTCPSGYSQHLIAIESGCEINVCLENGAFRPKGLLPPQLPPFESKPSFTPYPTERLTVIGSDGSIIVRNTAGQWESFSRDSEEATSFYELLQQMNDTNPTTTVGDDTSNTSTKTDLSAASLVLSTIALASVIIVIFGLLSCKFCSHRCKHRSTSTEHILHDVIY